MTLKNVNVEDFNSPKTVSDHAFFCCCKLQCERGEIPSGVTVQGGVACVGVV